MGDYIHKKLIKKAITALRLFRNSSHTTVCCGFLNFASLVLALFNEFSDSIGKRQLRRYAWSKEGFSVGVSDF